ncbi:Non-catalytic module family DOC2, partial [Piromyces sp. E2]
SSSTTSSCWATKLGYSCCKYTKIVVETDNSGRWGIENNNWCGIIETSSCWATKLGYKCCTSRCPQEEYRDNDGSWGIENNNWCGI